MHMERLENVWKSAPAASSVVLVAGTQYTCTVPGVTQTVLVLRDMVCAHNFVLTPSSASMVASVFIFASTGVVPLSKTKLPFAVFGKSPL